MADETQQDLDEAVARRIWEDPKKSELDKTNQIIFEVFGGDVALASQNWLQVLGFNGLTEEQKKQASATIALVVAKQEMEIAQAELAKSTSIIKERFEAGDFLKGENWQPDLVIVQDYAEDYFHKYDLAPESVTQEEAILSIETGLTVVAEASDDPKKIAEVVEDPHSRRLHNMAIFMEQRLMANGYADPEKTPAERIEEIKAELAKMPKEKFDALNHTCNEEAKTCEMVLHSEKDRAQFSTGLNQMNRLMTEKHGQEYKAIASLPPEEREAAMNSLRAKAIGEIAEKDPETAKLLAETIEKFKNSPDLMEKFDAIYGKVEKSFIEKMSEGAKQVAGAVAATASFLASPVTETLSFIGKKITVGLAERIEEASANPEVENSLRPNEESKQTPVSELPKEVQDQAKKLGQACGCSHDDKPKETDIGKDEPKHGKGVTILPDGRVSIDVRSDEGPQLEGQNSQTTEQQAPKDPTQITLANNTSQSASNGRMG